MTEARFVQIAAAEASDALAHVYALDESGRVWEYDFNQKKWHALEETRQPMFTR